MSKQIFSSKTMYLLQVEYMFVDFHRMLLLFLSLTSQRPFLSRNTLYQSLFVTYYVFVDSSSFNLLEASTFDILDIVYTTSCINCSSRHNISKTDNKWEKEHRYDIKVNRSFRRNKKKQNESSKRNRKQNERTFYQKQWINEWRVSVKKR